MANSLFNTDFVDFIEALNQANVKYILVGGYSVIIHGYNRTTGDIDLWVEQTPENYLLLSAAFGIFGMPLFDMTQARFMSNDLDVFTYGRPPVSIDLLTRVKGLSFDETFAQAQIHEIDGIKVRVIHLNHLRQAKTAANRPKDQDDLLNLPEKP